MQQGVGGVSKNPKPCTAITRWTALRRFEAITAVRIGQETPGTLLSRHGVGSHEITLWQAAFDRMGLAGLSARALDAFAHRMRAV
jgi:hypothetical protein